MYSGVEYLHLVFHVGKTYTFIQYIVYKSFILFCIMHSRERINENISSIAITVKSPERATSN